MARITTGCFAGPAGRLEYILSEPDGSAEAARRAAVVCHAHPRYGGTMHTKVVFQTAQVLVGLGLPVLRFHYRGVGKSQGSYDHGRGEQSDLAAAIGYIRGIYPVPLVLAGFSFGATIVAKTLASGPRAEVIAAALLGTPVDSYGGEIPTEWQWGGPKLMVSGAQDQFASVASLEDYYAKLAPPKARAWIGGADHFMTGQMEAYRQALREGLSTMVN